MTTEAPPVPERRVSLWKRVLLTLGLLLAASLGILLLVGMRTSSAGCFGLAEVIAETDRLDPRWRWEQIDEDRPMIPNVGNSVMRTRMVEQASAGWGRNDLQTADGKDLFEEWPANHRLDAERLAILRKAVEKQQRAIEIAVTLKDFPRGRAPLTLSPDAIGTLLPDAQRPRNVAHLLRLESEQLLHDRRADDVPDRVRAILHSAAGLRDEPTLISQLVRLACRAVAARQVERALGLGTLNDDACRRLADHFAAERAENLLLAGLRGERASLHALFENLESGRVKLADFYHAIEGRTGTAPDLLVRGGAMLYSPRVYEDHASFLRWANRACSIADKPAHEQTAEWAAYEKEFKAFVAESRRTYHNIITTLLMPAIVKVSEATRRDQALLGCIEVALAAERFRMANRRWPKTLAALRPKLLRDVPIDPYTGSPLLLASTEAGIVVYSASQDGKDDGGKVLDPHARMKPGTDYGVRLWNLERRGLEPPKLPALPPE
jgi:hypothetical protein